MKIFEERLPAPKTFLGKGFGLIFYHTTERIFWISTLRRANAPAERLFCMMSVV